MLPEGRVGIVDLASQLGHSPTMTLNTYGHVIAELREAPKQGATEAIMRLRGDAPREAHQRKSDLPSPARSRRRRRADTRTRTGDPFITRRR